MLYSASKRYGDLMLNSLNLTSWKGLEAWVENCRPDPVVRVPKSGFSHIGRYETKYSLVIVQPVYYVNCCSFDTI
mgnify:CR=1 FL=1